MEPMPAIQIRPPSATDEDPAVRKGRWSHGWVIVAVSFVLLIGALSVQLSFGLFLKPLTEEFGWSRAAASGAMSLLMGVSGLTAMVMGRATDSYGARAAVLPGVLIGALSCLLLARMSTLGQFYLLYGGGGGILVGCCFTPAVTAVSWCFDLRRRTMAIGVVLLGPIVGQMILSPVISQIIEANGWRTAWVVLAPIVFICGLPALAMLGRKPAGEKVAAAGADTRASADGRKEAVLPEELSAKEACNTLAFWTLMLASAVLGLGFTGFAAHVVAYATDTGVSASAAALILTVGSAGGVAGSLLAGTITTRLGFKYALFGLSALNGMILFLFIPAGGIWTYFLLSAILGFAFNCVNPMRMAVIPRLFGMRAVGSIVGLSVLSFCLGAIAGPFIAGYVFDSTGDYDLAFLIFGVLQMIGALFLYFLEFPKMGHRVLSSPSPESG